MPERPEDPQRQQQGPSRHSPLIKPFVVLALPGMYLFYKYNQYKRKRKENATRRLAEKELQHLNSKIGGDIVLILPTEGHKPDETIGERIVKEGKRVYNVAEQCTVYAPRALLVVCVPPVSVMTPLVTEVFKKTNFYHPGRIVGSAAIAQEKLLSKLEESELELATCQEEECVICIHAKATMQTSPCGHQVVCRKCFVKTIQIAVSQRLLPLRCVICRAKVLRLKTGPVFPSSVSGYSVTSRNSSVPSSDSLYSVSSGGSSFSSSSSSGCYSTDRVPPHHHNHPSGGKCCKGNCVGGAYPRQPPVAGVVRKSQKQDMKMTLKDYCRAEKNHINRLPPIREASPLHSVPPASTRIRCAQKIVTQLEMPLLGRAAKGHKYEKLPQEDDEVDEELKSEKKGGKRWWWDNGGAKCEEKIDNKKNEITEKNLEMKEKFMTRKMKKINEDKDKYWGVVEEDNF